MPSVPVEALEAIVAASNRAVCRPILPFPVPKLRGLVVTSSMEVGEMPTDWSPLTPSDMSVGVVDWAGVPML